MPTVTSSSAVPRYQAAGSRAAPSEGEAIGRGMRGTTDGAIEGLETVSFMTRRPVAGMREAPAVQPI